MATIPPWPATITPLTLKGGAGFRHDSAARCSDGRVIYVYVDGNNIYQCHYPSVGAFEHADNAAATTPVEFHSTLNSAVTNPLSTVWRHPSTGVLYLLVNYRTTVPSADGRVWSSPSGNGESSPGVPDWTAQGTVFGPVTTTFGADLGFNAYVGEPFVTGTGRWILTSYQPATWDTGQSAIYTSDNEGATWTLRSTFGYGPGNRYGYGMGRNIVDHAGKIWAAHDGNVGPAEGTYTVDDGATWTQYVVDGSTTGGYANPVTASGSAAWRMFTDPAFHAGFPWLQIGSDFAGVAATWADAADMTTMDGYSTNGVVLQRLSAGHDVFLWDGHVLAMPGGWGVGQVRIA